MAFTLTVRPEAELDHYTESQAHAVHDEEVGVIARFAGGLQQMGQLCLGEDVGQGFDDGRFDDVDPLPLLFEHVGIEEQQAVAVQFDGAPGEGLDEGGEVGFQIFAAEAVGAAVEEGSNTAHGARVGLNGAGAFALAR